MNQPTEDIPARIKAENPLRDILQRGGVELRIISGRTMCCCLVHDDSTPSMSVDLDRGLWKCFGCNQGGDEIRLLALLSGVSDADYIRTYAEQHRANKVAGNGHPAPARAIPERLNGKPKPEKPEDRWPVVGKDQPTAVYPYSNLFGTVVYEVCRFERPNPAKPSGYEKTFRQRRPDGNGGWVWNMDGIERVLYRLPEVAASQTIFVTEGEKDTNSLVALGLCATCNVSGAGKWMDGYSDSLAGKDVALCGDNDKPGRDHIELVFESIARKARSVRIIRLPESVKDVTDYIATFTTPEAAKAALDDLFNAATPHVHGVKLPLYSMADLEKGYKAYVAKLNTASLNLAGWLPSLAALRRLVPGELAFFLGATGIGKTSLLANLALKAMPLTTVFFEMELPAVVMFERFIGMKAQMSGRQVEQAYSESSETFGEAWLKAKFPSIYVCDQAKISVAEMESIIVKSELKTGQRAQLVLVDYVQLIGGKGASRYERASAVAEDLKVLAKTTQTIVVCASQVSRKGPDDNKEITLHDGKDSGSIENSSGLVIGAWRDEEDGNLMWLKVLKATKGGAGLTIPCNYNTHNLLITERAQQPASSHD